MGSHAGLFEEIAIITALTKNDWKELIFYGLGGLLLFILTGDALAVDILSYQNQSRIWSLMMTTESSLKQKVPSLCLEHDNSSSANTPNILFKTFQMQNLLS